MDVTILTRGLLIAVLLAVSSWTWGAQSDVIGSSSASTNATWDSHFAESKILPFHINLYSDAGFYYEFVLTKPTGGEIRTTLFSDKKRMSGRVGVKMQVDASVFEQDGDLPEVDNDIEVRRLRVFTYGQTYLLSPVTYGLKFGITDGTFYLNDGYIWWHDVKFAGSIKVGFFKAPMSLEALEGTSVTTFMETASPVNAFAPGYKFGLQLGDALFNQRATLYGGWYADASSADTGDASQSNTRLIGRATHLLIDNKTVQSPHLLHWGVSGSAMTSTGGGFQYRSRPQNHLAPYLVDTGVIDGDRALVGGAEAAWVKGPLSVQSELLVSAGDDNQGNTFRFGGAYLSGSWVLTGESRRYDRKIGVFKGIDPARNFSFRNRTWGAWQWAVRASHLDLTDDSIQGGVMNIVSTGLNCYLSKRNRIMLDCGYADIKDSATPSDLLYLQTRFQVEF